MSAEAITAEAGMRARRLSAIVLAAAITLVALGVLMPGAAQARCVTRLDVRVAVPDGLFAAGYTKRLRVRVSPRGVPIRNLRAELYTFSGQRMGLSAARRTVRVVATLSIRLGRVFRPLQAGAYTLVLTGEPNRSRSCGPKQAVRTLRLRACMQALPVTFGKLPGGQASDYGGYLSVPVRSNGAVIADMRSVVYGSDGAIAGRAPALTALFGEATLDHKLLRALSPGTYTVVVEGLIAEQPRACGRKAARATMVFQ